MHRRTFIGGLGSAVLVTLTGCGTGEAPPSPPANPRRRGHRPDRRHGEAPAFDGPAGSSTHGGHQLLSSREIWNEVSPSRIA